MVEGSLWVYGRTRLADYYEGRLSFRELANRLLALPHHPPNRAPIWDVLAEQDEKAQARRQVADIEDVLARFKP